MPGEWRSVGAIRAAALRRAASALGVRSYTSCTTEWHASCR